MSEGIIRTAEPHLAVRFSINQVTLLVDRSVVPATEQREMPWGLPGPVTDVMALPEPHPAAREAAAPVAVLERPP